MIEIRTNQPPTQYRKRGASTAKLFGYCCAVFLFLIAAVLMACGISPIWNNPDSVDEYETAAKGIILLMFGLPALVLFALSVIIGLISSKA